ncbi:MAG: 3-dehydroquinate synthase [Deltaproteobacteria bacterium]|nr:3-dehydroquinate synthase [Deltaproteobacteria bacterium]
MSLAEIKLNVPLTRKCPILMGPGAVTRLGDFLPETTTRAVLICDADVLRLHGDIVLEQIRGANLDPLTLPFEPGEQSKDISTVTRIRDSMFRSAINRNALVIALGGGVAMDLAGYVASTYMRGLSLINIPTSLLADVDAGIGGKTGVNNAFGKNLIGAFHWPVAVIGDTDFLATLPPEEVRCGLAETVKAGVVADPSILADLEGSAEALAAGTIPAPGVIQRAVHVKADVVSRDPLELGERRVLNFGHTAGHGIEAATSFGTRHGDAVAAGMVIEGRVAVATTGFSADDQRRLETLLDNLGLETRPMCRFDQALPSMLRDKKGLDGVMRMALPTRLGRMDEAGNEWVVEVPSDLVEACWNG